MNPPTGGRGPAVAGPGHGIFVLGFARSIDVTAGPLKRLGKRTGRDARPPGLDETEHAAVKSKSPRPDNSRVTSLAQTVLATTRDGLLA